jgi:hypothetical protein
VRHCRPVAFKKEKHMSPKEEEEFIYQTSTDIMKMAAHDALVDAYLELAASLGVSQIGGFPVREFYERKKTKIAADLLRDFADVSAEMASKIKRVWDEMDNKRQEHEE